MAGNIERWKAAAEALNLGIPDDRLETAAPVLEALMASARKSLDRDLSLVEPVTVFRPQAAPKGKA
ncbi:MAG: hypothetical protein R2748_30310 [Bryobacterales bacterium]